MVPMTAILKIYIELLLNRQADSKFVHLAGEKYRATVALFYISNPDSCKPKKKYFKTSSAKTFIHSPKRQLYDQAFDKSATCTCYSLTLFINHESILPLNNVDKISNCYVYFLDLFSASHTTLI